MQQENSQFLKLVDWKMEKSKSMDLNDINKRPNFNGEMTGVLLVCSGYFLPRVVQGRTSSGLATGLRTSVAYLCV